MGKFSWIASVFLVITLFMIPKVTSSDRYLPYNYCSNTSTFASTDTNYPKNLNTVFNSLSSAAATSTNGFATASAGNETNDAVFGLFLCRGDQTPSSCSDCVATAVKDQPKTTTCPRSKVGITYYDRCMIRYDNQNFFGRMDQTPRLELYNTQNINGNQTRFTELLGDTLTGLAGQTANGGTGKKYGTKVVNFTSLEKVYVLEQCTPDLSASDCGQCLTIAIGQMMAMSQGGTILQPSCNVRYEIYPFFNGAANAPPPPPSSPPSAAANGSTSAGSETDNGKKKVSGKTIAAIVVPVAVASLAVLVIGTCLITKKAKKYDPVAFERGEDFTDVESLQYDLATLQSATNNFSDENKLGEGGFGGVYKGSLPGGQVIAVKRLSRSSSQGIQEFKNEVLVVAKLQHRNLVRLLGFCVAGEEKLLVYEYVPNKSLDYFLFDPEKQGQLSWSKRYKIIAGIARGMVYLCCTICVLMMTNPNNIMLFKRVACVVLCKNRSKEQGLSLVLTHWVYKSTYGVPGTTSGTTSGTRARGVCKVKLIRDYAQESWK